MFRGSSCFYRINPKPVLSEGRIPGNCIAQLGSTAPMPAAAAESELDDKALLGAARPHVYSAFFFGEDAGEAVVLFDGDRALLGGI